MAYAKKHNLGYLAAVADNYSDLAMEYKDPAVDGIIEQMGKDMEAGIAKLKALKGDPALLAQEPDALDQIRALRPNGVRVMAKELPADYRKRLAGAVIGRTCGCILGAIVEAYEIEYMEKWAAHHGDSFPPTDYFSAAPGMPGTIRYTKSPNEAYLKQNMTTCPVDDDIAYMLLNLLVLEQYGLNFTTADLGKAWVQYLPMAYTAEEIALNHLKAGVDALEAGGIDNPSVQLIGADIRSDAWGYVAPGLPQFAAELAHRDGYLSHRRNGLYGEMLFSAAIAAAFCAKDAIEAIEIGLQEIPADCWLAKEVRWALAERHNIHDYKQARAAVDSRFPGMPIAHTVNNACLTVFGLHIGGNDYTKLISQTVAMGLDNDCTTATAGSLFGAVYGIDAIEKRWYEPFHNVFESYLNGIDRFAIDDVINRFAQQAGLVHRCNG